MTRSIVPVRLAVAALFAVGLAGCAAGGGASPSTGPVASSPPSAVPSPTATAPEPPAPSLAEPPVATLAAEGGDPITGSVGSFTWADGGSDSPWLPGAPIDVGAGESLTVALPPGVPVKDWTARRVPAGVIDGSGAVPLGSGSTPISFKAPPVGDWSVQVVVTFGDDLGSATYYWQVTVT